MRAVRIAESGGAGGPHARPGQEFHCIVGTQGRSSGDRLQKLPRADHVDHALDIVGEDVERHFGANIPEPTHLEMGGPHRGLDRSERMLDRAAPGALSDPVFPPCARTSPRSDARAPSG